LRGRIDRIARDIVGFDRLIVHLFTVTGASFPSRDDE
jgi:hypothetical protein